MNKKLLISHFLLLISILIIAAFFRLYNLKEFPPGLYPDEAMNGNNALEALSSGHILKSLMTFGNSGEGFKVFYPENNGREGLFINIQAISVAIFGNFPWALRLVSAIFGILTVLGVYFLAKELFRENPKSEIRNPKQYQNSNVQNQKRFRILNFNNWNLFRNSNLEFRNYEVALLSSFLLATSFWHINFSRIGFRAIMAPFFLTWALYFLIKSLRNKSFKWMALAGFVFGMGIHSYIAYRATPLIALVVFGYWFLKFKEERKNLAKKFVVFVIFAFIAALPLFYYFAVHPQDFFGRTGQISVFNSPTPIKDLALNIVKTAGMFNFQGDFNWRHNYAGKPELFWPAGILFIVGIIIGIYNIFKTSDDKTRTSNQVQNPESENLEVGRLNFIGDIKFGFWILFAWLVAAALPIVISNEGLPHALRAIIMIPPVFIIAGFGGIWLYEKLRLKFQSRKFLHLISYILLLVLASEAYYTYFISWGMNPNTQGAFAQNYADIGKQLNSLPKELPKYVMVKANGTNVRGIPMPTQTVMFITDTFTPDKQKNKNIFYVLPDQINKIPAAAYTVAIE